MWAQLSEDILEVVFRSVATAPAELSSAERGDAGAAASSARGLAAVALVCRPWRAVALGASVVPLWRALHWEHCRHTDPPLPDLVEGLFNGCSGGELMTYRRRAVCSRARRAEKPVFFQARGRADHGVLVPADTLQCVDRLLSSLTFRYIVLRFERSVPQTPEETKLLSQEGAYNEAMLRSYTAEGEYDSYPTVEFDRLVVEHAEPRSKAEEARAEVQSKQDADWLSLFVSQKAEDPSNAASEERRYRLTTEEYRYVLFDWTLHPSTTNTQPNADGEQVPEEMPAPVTVGGSSDAPYERHMRPSDVWSDRRAGTHPRGSVEEIGSALLFVQWKPGRLGLRRNFRYDMSSSGVRTALGIARPLDHRFVLHQGPSLPPSQGHSISGYNDLSSSCNPMATVQEVDAHVRQAWTMEIDTRNFFATAARASGESGSNGEIGSTVEDHIELHAAFVRHGSARTCHDVADQSPPQQQEAQRSSTDERPRWRQAPDTTPAVGRPDHVAELARRKATLEAEIAEARARSSR